MEVRLLLRELDLGSSVAEFDEALNRYFVETEAFRALALDKADIVAGEKGTGKTALYRVFKQRYTSIPELGKVEVVAGFNAVGNPIFQRLVQVLRNAGFMNVMRRSRHSRIFYRVVVVGGTALPMSMGASPAYIRDCFIQGLPLGSVKTLDV